MSTQPAPSSASSAVQGLDLLMTDAWVRQSHIPLQRSTTATTALTRWGVSDHRVRTHLGFPSWLSVLGHIYAYEVAAVSSMATSCAVNDFLTAHDAAQLVQHVCMTQKLPAADVCNVLLNKLNSKLQKRADIGCFMSNEGQVRTAAMMACSPPCLHSVFPHKIYQALQPAVSSYP